MKLTIKIGDNFEFSISIKQAVVLAILALLC
jgi:hypothetical protein